ncbi:cold-regulated 413 inner membrane protein 1, chloroplastic-like [Cornus florida]|uniref:cold-regulated 413 inner membrane protein 1, chloroplastic-like n=1 Tax=Cornus florida TaxID=4283 RepID=UPI0028A232FE|nr:cold-regulated 413 inner membrane protein 1, chloroplastic-like [Cornus florida]
MLTLSLSSAYSPSFHNRHTLSLQSPPPQSGLLRLTQDTPYLRFNPPGVSVNCKEVMKRNRRGFGPVCYSAPLTPRSLQWISTVSSAVLLLARGTGVQKSFAVPLFALQAPASLISWIKGEYGIWTAFLALLVRLFFSIPGELELPFIALLLVIVAPYQVLNLRGTKEGVMLSLVIAGYLAFQHFTRAGSLRKAFDQSSVVATLAIICIVAVSCLLLI